MDVVGSDAVLLRHAPWLPALWSRVPLSEHLVELGGNRDPAMLMLLEEVEGEQGMFEGEKSLRLAGLLELDRHDAFEVRIPPGRAMPGEGNSMWPFEDGELPDDGEFLAFVLDVEPQRSAQSRFQFDLQAAGRPWTHPRRERLGIEPFGVDDVRRCAEHPLDPGDQGSRRGSSVHCHGFTSRDLERGAECRARSGDPTRRSSVLESSSRRVHIPLDEARASAPARVLLASGTLHPREQRRGARRRQSSSEAASPSR